MYTSKYREGIPCALVGGDVGMVARTKRAYRLACGFIACKTRMARAAAAPRCVAAVAAAQRSQAAAARRFLSARQRLAHKLVQRALHAGDGPSDLDRRGAAFRIAMWSFVAIAGLVWLPLGWKLATLPLLAAATSGGIATAFWDAASELERREHPYWEEAAQPMQPLPQRTGGAGP